MPNRQNTPGQDQNQKGRNPAVLQEDDDESADLDPVRADQQPLSDEQRQALNQRQDGRRRPEENIEQIEDEEAEDDEDESDGISQRP
jgi:hypothetical protein